jgi:hypothetical protein
MSDRYAILGMLVDTGDLYQVPIPAATTVASSAASDPEVSPRAVSVQRQTLLTSVVVCETNNAGASFSLFVVKYEDGSGDPVSQLFDLLPLTAKQTHVITLNLTLSPGDKVTFTKASGAIDITAFGVEMTTGRGPN